MLKMRECGNTTLEACTNVNIVANIIKMFGYFYVQAHKTPKECPAIDYTRHTLDELALRNHLVAKLGSVCRRVYRIFLMLTFIIERY
ncbi:MOB kinase activator-like 4 [Gryllus bimaculatus]|nr:MOB kinase activator-like 4 [Gryllus bimaculatus]